MRRSYHEPVQSVFISSIQRGFGDVREAARRTVESLGMRPLMAELAGATPSSPQRALLDLVGAGDVFLLIVGPRYSKPTEDEFGEARRRAKPILVLRQEGELEPEQEQFLDRVAGGWHGGRLWGTFRDASDVGYVVVQALTNMSSGKRTEEVRPQAEERARELARGKESGGFSSGSSARVAHAPLLEGVLLDALRLDAPDLGDHLAALAREHQLIAQSLGIEPRVTRAGVSLHQVGRFANSSPMIAIAADGAVVTTVDVAGDDQFGSMRVDPTRLEDGIRRSGEFARAVWAALDEGEDVQQVAVAVGIPEAQHKVFGVSTGSDSISMGSFGMPQTVLVPEPPAVIRRADVGGAELTRRLVAEVRRVFADAGAVEK